MHVTDKLRNGENMASAAGYLRCAEAYAVLKPDGGVIRSLADDTELAKLTVRNGIYEVVDKGTKRVHFAVELDADEDGNRTAYFLEATDLTHLNSSLWELEHHLFGHCGEEEMLKTSKRRVKSPRKLCSSCARSKAREQNFQTKTSS
jgi:NAD(P)H-flavin reductase